MIILQEMMFIAHVATSVTATHSSRDAKNYTTLIYILDTAIPFYRATQIARPIPWEASDGMPKLN